MEHLRKPGPNYRMSRQHKAMLAQIVDPHKRGLAKRLIIHADLCGRDMQSKNKLPKNNNK